MASRPPWTRTASPTSVAVCEWRGSHAACHGELAGSRTALQHTARVSSTYGPPSSQQPSAPRPPSTSKM